MTFKELLKEKNITMYRLAKQTKLGQGTINEIANGKRKDIQLDTGIKIANILGVDAQLINDCIRGTLNENENRND
ncbi:helix-turn-helix domain-containing protein [Clostridium gasigenes]|uniref:helix-turn-helix domain-containing protein n=1 Tax=Clostridium gasigenes TaxID=94869 RepID=UPI001C0E3BFF|nr:helix-turn-helix transcriptional regulator [Clostridium gasigenes]